MTRGRFLSPETIAEFRGPDIYWHLVKTRICEFNDLGEFLRERFPVLTQNLPLEHVACEKIAKAIRLETGIELAIVESALSEYCASSEYLLAHLMPGAKYHDPLTGMPVATIPESDQQALAKFATKGVY